ncbi:MAG: hypothetical protein M3R13_03615 [Armatimonadota bacterium]|nr:hypothetical protein [Armatimonadota bacterium]
MKRKSNGILVGTILIVLVGALIFLQARNQEPVEEDMAGPPPTAPAGGSKPAPSVDDLQNQIGGSGRSPVPAPQ